MRTTHVVRLVDFPGFGPSWGRGHTVGFVVQDLTSNEQCIECTLTQRRVVDRLRGASGHGGAGCAVDGRCKVGKGRSVDRDGTRRSHGVDVVPILLDTLA